MDLEAKQELIQRIINKSEEAYKDSIFNFENGALSTSENRLYYSVFYIVSALALKHNYANSKHSSLFGWFNKKIHTRRKDIFPKFSQDL